MNSKRQILWQELNQIYVEATTIQKEIEEREGETSVPATIARETVGVIHGLTEMGPGVTYSSACGIDLSNHEDLHAWVMIALTLLQVLHTIH